MTVSRVLKFGCRYVSSEHFSADRTSNNTAATLCYAGHLLMENRSALIVDAELTIADGYAERATAVEMLSHRPKMACRRTIAADKACDTRGFVADVRKLNLSTRAQAVEFAYESGLIVPGAG